MTRKACVFVAYWATVPTLVDLRSAAFRCRFVKTKLPNVFTKLVVPPG